MELRAQFIADWRSGSWTVSELCADYGVSRKTGYKWIGRFEQHGAAGLQDQSRRPHRSPHAVAASTIDRLVALRRRFPHWGARKLLVIAAKQDPGIAWPSRATLCAHLTAAGLTHCRRVCRPRVPRTPSALTAPTAANIVWTADYKGQFRTRDHHYCYPFTLRDGFSRFVLRCDARLAPTGRVTRVSCERAFAAYGLPDCIRTDNGAPFARPGLGHLSRLSVWWIRLGIRPERPSRMARTSNSIAC